MEQLQVLNNFLQMKKDPTQTRRIAFSISLLIFFLSFFVFQLNLVSQKVFEVIAYFSIFGFIVIVFITFSTLVKTFNHKAPVGEFVIYIFILIAIIFYMLYLYGSHLNPPHRPN